MTLRIAVVVGSLRAESFNRRVAAALIELGPKDFAFEHAKIGDLPLYNQDDDANPPASATRLKKAISDADGVMIVTPEYNRSIPGVLKNALDHASRPYGKSAWAGKPAGVIGVSPATTGTAIAQQHLRCIMAYLDMPTLGQPEAFLQWSDDLIAADGAFGPKSRKHMQRWMDRFADWVRSHQGT